MPSYTLRQIVLYMLRLGSLGFGGPVALIGYMHRDLVEQRRWISEEDYNDGLALAQLAPGPLAAQMAIYLGFVDFGVIGATLVGLGVIDWLARNAERNGVRAVLGALFAFFLFRGRADRSPSSAPRAP